MGKDMRVCLNGNASETSTDTNRGLECLAHQGELQRQVGIGIKQPRKLPTDLTGISPEFEPYFAQLLFFITWQPRH